LIKLSDSCLGRKNRHELVGQEIKNTQERIKVLQKWKEETRESIAMRKPILNNVKLDKQKGQEMLSQLNNSTNAAKNDLVDNSVKNKKVFQYLEVTRSQLKEVIRENVTQLVKYIFPITWEGLNSEEDSESLATVKDALADASQTAYVRGQWIYADTGHNGQYRIAGVCLPGTGDMASYQLCVNQASKNGDTETLGHFKVALSHITQLSHLLSFYLGVRLPKKVTYLDFMKSDLNSDLNSDEFKRFAGRISRLHANILFLCASQAVDPVHLRHANPLARLLTLTELNICDLGRIGPIAFHPELWSFEETGEEEAYGFSTGEEDGDPLNTDWESVIYPAVADTTSNQSSPTNSRASSEIVPSRNVMEGVVSSVASLWKAWPWSK